MPFLLFLSAWRNEGLWAKYDADDKGKGSEPCQPLMLGQYPPFRLPRVAGQMSDDPDIMEHVTGRRCLRVRETARDGRAAQVPGHERLISDEAGSETLRLVETEEIQFGLRMMMRRITGPSAGISHHFANNQI
jgi:hypothetical protein